MNVNKASGATGAAGASGGDEPRKTPGKVEAFFQTLKPRKKKDKQKEGAEGTRTGSAAPRQPLSLGQATPASSSSSSAPASTPSVVEAISSTPGPITVETTATKRSFLKRLVGDKAPPSAEKQYKALKDKHSKACRALAPPNTPTHADFVSVMSMAEELSALKPEDDHFHKAAPFQRAGQAGEYSLMLEWMRRVDNFETHMEFLTGASFGVRERNETSPAAQDFIAKVTAFYLQELPSSVLGPDRAEKIMSHAELFKVMAEFGREAGKMARCNAQHAQQLFDSLPRNLGEALDVMPAKMARTLFSGIDDIRSSLKLLTDRESTNNPRSTPLTASETRAAERIYAFRRLSLLKASDVGVRMDAKLGVWSMQGANYEQATYRIANCGPRSFQIEECVSQASRLDNPVDLRGLKLASLPEGMHTLNYITSFDLANNQLQRIPMEMAHMTYFSKGYVERNPESARIEIDLRGNPLSKMKPHELELLDNPQARPGGPIFKLPPVIYLDSGEQFHSSQALVLRNRPWQPETMGASSSK